MAGIEKSQEVLADVNTMLDQALKALADGSLSLSDLQYVPAAFAAATEAVKAAKYVPEELKDLDRGELEALAAASLSVAYKVAALVKSVLTPKV